MRWVLRERYLPGNTFREKNRYAEGRRIARPFIGQNGENIARGLTGKSKQKKNRNSATHDKWAEYGKLIKTKIISNVRV